MDHVGIDVHKKDSHICIVAEGGELIERRVRTEVGRLAEMFEQRPHARILIEASTDSEWVARCLEGLGHEVVVADPNFAPMYATRRRTVKTDRRDARALADACVLGAYRPAHRLSDAQRHVRGRLGVREALVRTRTRYISLIRARVRQDGGQVPTGSAEGFGRRVLALRLPGRLLAEVAPLLAVMRHGDRQLAYADERIAAFTATDPRVRRLRSVPCVGPVTAAAFVAALDDAQRFRRAHEVEAYRGLVPQEWSSGESPRRGRITKAGSRRVRWLLIQAAVSMRRLRDPRTAGLREWAERIAARRGRKIAVGALARRLAGILFALLRDGTVYESRLGQAPRRQPAVPA
ncbi:MAG: IS110 family transposase [Gemmatimonadales bacterium]